MCRLRRLHITSMLPGMQSAVVHRCPCGSMIMIKFNDTERIHVCASQLVSSSSSSRCVQHSGSLWQIYSRYGHGSKTILYYLYSAFIRRARQCCVCGIMRCQGPLVLNVLHLSAHASLQPLQADAPVKSSFTHVFSCRESARKLARVCGRLSIDHCVSLSCKLAARAKLPASKLV
jgi:hypothetical protein